MSLRSKLSVFTLAVAMFAGATLAHASSHSEAPGTAKDKLADDTDQILVKTFPESYYFTGSLTTPWWKFWEREKESFGVQATGHLADKPWWKFWD